MSGKCGSIFKWLSFIEKLSARCCASHLWIHIYIYMYIHVYIHTYVCIYIHIYMYIHI